jgi:acyl-CoA reductase-like NAD-dependent aldehyde dehydrogenase
VPDGVLNVVTGYGTEVGSALVSDSRIRKLDITGGTQTGRIVASQAGSNLIECIAELGGKSPVVVFPDAVEEAVNGAMFAAFIASGQVSLLTRHVSWAQECLCMNRSITNL